MEIFISLLQSVIPPMAEEIPKMEDLDTMQTEFDWKKLVRSEYMRLRTAKKVKHSEKVRVSKLLMTKIVLWHLVFLEFSKYF